MIAAQPRRAVSFPTGAIDLNNLSSSLTSPLKHFAVQT